MGEVLWPLSLESRRFRSAISAVISSVPSSWDAGVFGRLDRARAEELRAFAFAAVGEKVVSVRGKAKAGIRLADTGARG